MILQALYELAKSEGLVEDPDFEWKPVAWLIRVGGGGEYLGLVGTHTVPEKQAGKKAPRPEPKQFRIPRRQASRSGSAPPPEFLADNSLYVLGLNTKDKETAPEKAAARAQGFRDYVAECARDTGDDGARAVVQFLDRHRTGDVVVSLPEGTLSNETFAFVFEKDIDRLVTDRPAVVQWWRSRRIESGGLGEAMRCLVSGQMAPPVEKHPKIKNLPGGNTSGTALISFNSPAFESYGWSVNENARISREAAEACGTALNRLLAFSPVDPKNPEGTLGRRNVRLASETVVCYWSSDSGAGGFVDIFDALLNANPESVGELYRSIWRGVPADIEDPSRFFALTISGAQGRAVVRDWLETTVKVVAGNLAMHFGDLEIARVTPPPKGGELPPQFAMNRLLESLCADGASDSAPPPLASELFESAISGTAYRFNVLQRAVERTRAEITRDSYADLCRLDARAALIKAFLNRRKRFHPDTTHYEEIQTVLDPNNESPGYLLGQLMAVLERAQQLAMDANATIVDRYFNGASAAPRSVFVRLLKSSQHHLRKAEDDSTKAGTCFLLRRLIDQLADRFDPKDGGFPARLAIEQQGLFVLGYHQMRRWLWLNGADRQEWEARWPDLPAAYKWSKTTIA
jgi:CRISPR-associated protein Csd1